MPRSAVVAVLSLVLLAGLIAGLVWRERPVSSVRPLIVLAAPTVRGPLESLAADFTRNTGREVVIDWGPSEQLVTTARFPAPHRPADVLIPADDSYLIHARDLGLLSDWTPIATVTAVLLLAPENPKRISDWADLHADGVRVAIPNESAAVGRLTREHLKKSGHWHSIAPRVVDSLNVSNAALATQAGGIDAAVVWDAVSAGPGFRAQRVLKVQELDGVTGTIAAGVLCQSPDAVAARAFVTHLTNDGRKRFQEAGFRSP
jgi:molybdate transport system substrate-binding protein